MLKKVVGLLMGILLLMVSVSFAEETSASIQSMTELGEIQKKLDQGITIGKVYYTDGYGFSTSEFTTDDPDEIAQLWNAVNAIRVGEKVNESITDWYPQIVFCLTDGTRGGVRFEAKWLCIGGMENYEISNAEGFWSLTASLVEKHEAMAEGAVRVGWNDDSDLIIVPKEVAWDGLPDGDYCIGVKDAGHLERGYFTLSLYAEDLYNRETIENLKQGDRILVQGETYTVGYIRIHGWYDSDGDGETDESGTYAKHPAQELADSRELVDEGDFNEAPDSFEISAYELIMLEDFPGYIVFEPVSDTECRSVVNDWSPCKYLGDVTIQLPLPDDFVFLDYADNEGNADTFLDNISEGWYSPYNSRAWFKNGQLFKVSHSDYPSGPEED